MADDTSGMVGKAKAVLAAARRRSRFLDHTMNTLKHYSNVQGGVLAGAVTYFGFLAFFPLLALAFAVVGYVARDFPRAEDSLVTAIQQVLPGIVTPHGGHNTISMDQIKNAKAAAGAIGFLGLMYSGLGWISGLRQALQGAFQVPPSKTYSFVVGKAVDLVVMVILGLVLVVSVGISGVVKGLTDKLISWMGLSGSAIGTPLVWAIGIVLGLAASTLLFFVMFKLLGASDLDAKPLWQGALLGAIGFELLKLLVVNVLGAVGGSPFAPLAIAITLVIWINYFSRLVVYGASWAMTSQLTASALAVRAARRLVAEQAAAEGEEAATPVAQQPTSPLTGEATGTLAGRFDPGSAIVGAAAAAVAALVFWRQD
ncbi:MAG: YihY/virulence factor BrkB family protein [Actinomycetota bacterium]|nr:YihY/virulence factor BrkB family protein [Actinomycetota bacterium]